MLKFYSTAVSLEKIVLLVPVLQKDFAIWQEQQDECVKNLLQNFNFKAKSGASCLIPDASGNLAQVLLVLDSWDDWREFGALPAKLPAGNYCVVPSTTASLTVEQLNLIAIGWGLGQYEFTRYKTADTDTKKADVVLQLPVNSNVAYITNVVISTFLVRDLINTPPADMTPQILAAEASKIAAQFGAEVIQVVGDELLAQNFPAIHAVGKGSSNPPRLLDIRWHWADGSDNPKITLVGKGVCFDSGGLNLKPSGYIEGMKKDMAGAAHALGLAKMVMTANLPIQLRVLLPIVENLPSGTSYKPDDILATRKGLTVEITNTDAEGRLILADALALAVEDKPDLLIDMATLTGAAWVALGEGIPALFSRHDKLATDISTAMATEFEPVWRLPLHKPYKDLLKSDIADISNCSSGRYAGAITAALFLSEFVTDDIPWAHFDMSCENTKASASKPKGGEAMCLRGIFRLLQEFRKI